MAAGKGFNVSTPPATRVVYVDRDSKRFVPAPPPKVVDEATQRGVEVSEVIRENQSPEHRTPGGKNHVAEEVPPMRRVDPPRPPMRLK